MKKTTLKDDDTDDPIAQAFKLREKAGGITSVLSAAEAKKLGIKVAEKAPEKIQDKATKAAKTAPAENGKKEDKA